MEKIALTELDNHPQAAAVMYRLTDVLGLADVAINYYELETGDSFAFAYHKHEIQEEIFYIEKGTVTFETENSQVQVDAGEMIRFGPGEYQRGWNYGDDRVIALALGAPLEYGQQVTLRYCQKCGERTDNRLERSTERGEPIRVACCEVCGTETGRWYRGSMAGEVP